MKLPVPPPDFSALLAKVLAGPDGIQRYSALVNSRVGAAPNDRYKHWDTHRHAPLTSEFSVEEEWLAIKLARRAMYRFLPLKDVGGKSFQYALPNAALEMLHQIDRSAGGNIKGSEQVTNPTTRDTYLFKSIVEEAITSSQLEGASTTRQVAKAMIQEGRAPRDRSEQMISNNYQAMLFVRERATAPLTPEFVRELQRQLTEHTLDEPDAAGRYRREDEDIVIEDDQTGARLHTPPPVAELEARMQAMCDFANGKTPGEFIPPVVRAIVLHFWLAYDHPFVDGNGRTARALFYWCMAREGYWLCEYVSISRILRQARAKYSRAHLYTESDENDVTYFLLHQMRVLLRAIHDLHAYLTRKTAELHEAEQRILQLAHVKGDLNQRQLALLNHALKTATARYTVESHRVSHGVSYETSRSDLLKLVAQGLLEVRKMGKAHVFAPTVKLRSMLYNQDQNDLPPALRTKLSGAQP